VYLILLQIYVSMINKIFLLLTNIIWVGQVVIRATVMTTSMYAGVTSCASSFYDRKTVTTYRSSYYDGNVSTVTLS